jgi:hypothetical protein
MPTQRGGAYLPVLKITKCVPTHYENSILYLILQPLTTNTFCRVLINLEPVLNMELSRFYHTSLRARVQTDRSESRCAKSNFPEADFWGVSGTLSFQEMPLWRRPRAF